MNHAVLIGINNFKKQTGLNGCVNDVEDISGHLTGSNSIDAKNVVKLIDAEATKEAILSALKEMVKKLKQGERAWVHFSTHGVRMPATAPGEPDGLDEVLCPHEFDWSPQTSIADHELAQILAGASAGSHIAVTVDSCHSGDMSRALAPMGSQPRTLTPPEGIKIQMAARRRSLGRGFRGLRAIPQVGFASACSPWETAADAPFDQGRFNGAFTYFLLKQAKSTPQKSIADLIADITAPLQFYSMTPVAEGATGIPFASSLVKRSLLQEASPEQVMVRASSAVFDQAFSASVFGQTLSVSALIASSNGGLDLYLRLSGLGLSLAVPPIRIEGDMSVPIPLNVLGLQLIVRISGFSMDAHAIRFTLAMDITTPIPFVPPIRVAAIGIDIPTSSLTRSSALAASPGSASELVAALTLQDIIKRKPSPRVGKVTRPRSGKSRDAASNTIEFNRLTCKSAEAIFGDTITVVYAGEEIWSGAVNTSGQYPIRQSRAIPEGGAQIEVLQHYAGQAIETIMTSPIISPSDEPREMIFDINPGDDGDPGGAYQLKVLLKP